jgi:predicted transcriptional regulator
MINQILSKLGIELDEKEKKLLALLLEEEPVTAYRLASDGKMHFSYVYRKLDRFEREELVAQFCEPGGDRRLYYAMPKGVITAMAYGLLSQKLLIGKLKNK